MEDKSCYHCGEACGKNPISYDEKQFCCVGCKTVFDILSDNDLSYYYTIQQGAGSTPKATEGKYDFLDNPAIVQKLIEFQNGNVEVVNLYIPHIHCSSCIWILENLNKLNTHISSSQVDFPQKTIRITYHPEQLCLRELVLLLARIGYEPYISLDDFDGNEKKADRSLIYKLGVAGFAFGNVMFLSFPEYFDLASSHQTGGEYWLNQYQVVFRWLMLLFSLPVVFYAGWDYFISAFKGLRSKILNIDVPIALGILVLFLRSSLEVILDLGSGFFDSLTGLVLVLSTKNLFVPFF